LLHLGGIVADDFVLDERSIAQVQQRLPNRLGTTSAHALWPGARQAVPDVRARACQRDCAAEPRIASALPAYARNAHGNLALQQRQIGGTRGVDTTAPATATAGAMPAVAAPAMPPGAAARADPATATMTLATKQGCFGCHGIDRQLVGPGFREIATRYRSDAAAQPDAVAGKLAAKIRGGASGTWGTVPMPAQAQVSAANAESLARWIAAGAPAQ
jgi:cytochrome c